MDRLYRLALSSVLIFEVCKFKFPLIKKEMPIKTKSGMIKK